MKNEILNSMESLIKDGESLTTETYTGSNPDAFKEFADVNGFDLNLVIEVYEDNEDYLQEIWESVNSN